MTEPANAASRGRAAAKEMPDRTTDPVPDEELEALICGVLDVLLSTLPPKQARIVRAVDLAGELPATVAETSGLSPDLVAAQLALGRQGLEERIEEMCIICPQHGLAGCDCQLMETAET